SSLLSDRELDLCLFAQGSVRAVDGDRRLPGCCRPAYGQRQHAGGSGWVRAERRRYSRRHSTRGQSDFLIEPVRRIDGNRAGSAAALAIVKVVGEAVNLKLPK